MKRQPPTPALLRALAGEGNFHIYRLLDSGHRLFLFAKCLRNTLSFSYGKSGSTSKRFVAYIKGPNQLRYHSYAREQLEAELGHCALFSSTNIRSIKDAKLLPRFSTISTLRQIIHLFTMLLSGNRRHLNLYLLEFYQSIEKSLAIGAQNVDTFVCYNDQPYDVAAIVHSLNKRENCRTIVIQHGLILSERFYFPSIAQEFWAWGDLSRSHYHSRTLNSQILVKGRYRTDSSSKKDRFLWPPESAITHILVAPSYFHDEIKDILRSLNDIMTVELMKTTVFAIKFHPSTKLAWSLRKWCKANTPWLIEEHDPMESLSKNYDALVTKNSTSAIDFLLNGKPTFFTELKGNETFPSQAYGFHINQLKSALQLKQLNTEEKRNGRDFFLLKALNV